MAKGVLMRSPGSPSDAPARLDAYLAGASRGDLAGDGAVRDALLAALDGLAAGRTRADPSISALPVFIPGAAWEQVERGIIERAGLLERIVADIYGPGTLVRDGALPGAVVTGSPHYLRPLMGLNPPGGWHLHHYAADLIRDRTGTWRVMADHTRTPEGLGAALSHRLASTRLLPDLQDRVHVLRYAPFFRAAREGLVAACGRDDAQLALLTPGPLNATYAEQALLARYLGLLLVEGDDLMVRDRQLFVRTVEGLHPIHGLWRRVDPRLLDPLALDPTSRLGVAGLIDAMAGGGLVIANAPGSGVLESRALASVVPALAKHQDRRPPLLDSPARRWLGTGADGDGTSLPGPLRPAFPGMLPPEDLARRPIDWVAEEAIPATTAPLLDQDTLVAAPVSLRVFAARDGRGRWQVLPGGLATLDGPDGPRQADVVVVSRVPVRPFSLITDHLTIRRKAGVLPSRIADSFFWLGRYLERAEQIVGLVTAAGDSVGDIDLARPATDQLRLRVGGSDARDVMARALGDTQPAALGALMAEVQRLSAGLSDRLPAPVLAMLDTCQDMPASPPAAGERLAAIGYRLGESLEHQGGWRFLDMGRRLERATHLAQLLLAHGFAEREGLEVLLGLSGNETTFRQRYPTGLSRAAVLDLVALDPTNPRALAFQMSRVRERLAALPRATPDGPMDPPEARAMTLLALLTGAAPATLTAGDVQGWLGALFTLSDEIAERFFLRASQPFRSDALVLA